MAIRDRLTAKQRRLVKDLDQITQVLGLDYESILDYDRSVRTLKLEAMIRRLARAAVVDAYTLVDELLADQICWFFFGRGVPFWKLWKTKRFRIFNHHILQDMYPLEKLRLVREIRDVPRPIVTHIQDLNTLRNAIAHAFFPENLKKAKPTWKGEDVFSLPTLKLFESDMQQVRDFFFGSEPGYFRDGRVVRFQKRGA